MTIPHGNWKENDRTPCPRCGSTNTWSNFPVFGCRDCGWVWDIDEEEVMIHERD